MLLMSVTPGPCLLRDHPQVFWGVIGGFYVGNVMLLLLNLPLVGLFARVATIRDARARLRPGAPRARPRAGAAAGAVAGAGAHDLARGRARAVVVTAGGGDAGRRPRGAGRAGRRGPRAAVAEPRRVRSLLRPTRPERRLLVRRGRSKLQPGRRPRPIRSREG